MIILLAALCLVMIGISIALVYRRTVFGPSVEKPRVEWIDEFSVNRYRPMERLFSEVDFDFLKSQYGYQPAFAKQLRSDRRKIFQAYLYDLTCDFNRMHAAAKLFFLTSSQDQSHLALLLFKQKAMFFYGLLIIEKRFLLYTLGIGTVDVSALVNSVERMREQIRGFAPALQFAA